MKPATDAGFVVLKDQNFSQKIQKKKHSQALKIKNPWCFHQGLQSNCLLYKTNYFFFFLVTFFVAFLAVFLAAFFTTFLAFFLAICCSYQ